MNSCRTLVLVKIQFKAKKAVIGAEIVSNVKIGACILGTIKFHYYDSRLITCSTRVRHKAGSRCDIANSKGAGGPRLSHHHRR